MKFLILFFTVTMFLYSCSEDIVTETNEGASSHEKSVTLFNASDFDLTGIPLNISVEQGLTSSRKYLSTNSTGTDINLWNEDAMSFS